MKSLRTALLEAQQRDLYNDTVSRGVWVYHCYRYCMLHLVRVAMGDDPVKLGGRARRERNDEPLEEMANSLDLSSLRSLFKLLPLCRTACLAETVPLLTAPYELSDFVSVPGVPVRQENVASLPLINSQCLTVAENIVAVSQGAMEKTFLDILEKDLDSLLPINIQEASRAHLNPSLLLSLDTRHEKAVELATSLPRVKRTIERAREVGATSGRLQKAENAVIDSERVIKRNVREAVTFAKKRLGVESVTKLKAEDTTKLNISTDTGLLPLLLSLILADCAQVETGDEKEGRAFVSVYLRKLSTDLFSSLPPVSLALSLTRLRALVACLESFGLRRAEMAKVVVPADLAENIKAAKSLIERKSRELENKLKKGMGPPLIRESLRNAIDESQQVEWESRALERAKVGFFLMSLSCIIFVSILMRCRCFWRVKKEEFGGLFAMSLGLCSGWQARSSHGCSQMMTAIQRMIAQLKRATRPSRKLVGQEAS